MTESVAEFYKELANDYHFIFADWRKSVLRQSEALDHLIRAQGLKVGASVLDCSCGIGTQAIGLAVRGYNVHGTDLSAEAVARAQQEAERAKVKITFGVSDFRELEANVPGTFDVVLSCDNSIAHLLTEEDLELALHNMRAKLNPGGLLLLSLRDYDTLIKEKPQSTLPVVADREMGRSIVFQVWDWAEDGRSYRLNHFTLKQQDNDWQTSVNSTRLRAWQRAEIEAALAATGLHNVTWHMPDDESYYQPIVTARLTD
ncbi:MAG: class I SAM-dependent methyltransferase [Anaerolineae bacterium]|nr:class I SAM-dependent methyltransferase [Anaerolineae bacterium]